MPLITEQTNKQKEQGKRKKKYAHEKKKRK